MGLLDPLYNPPTKYGLDLAIALVTILVNYLADDLDGWEYTYRASSIKTGTANWTLFFFYLILFFPQYWANFDKLKFISIVLFVFAILTIGCWVAASLGSGWKAHETFSKIALSAGPLTLAIVSATIFVFLDYFFVPVL